MARDLLKIALEHHHAGRLRQAEAGYLELLESDPGNPDANHWLGVLAFQAGRPDKAIPFLEQAAAVRRSDAAFWHNLAQAYLAVHRNGDAVKAFQRALEIEPERTQTLLAVAVAYLARMGQGDAPAAVEALRQAHAAGLDTPELHYQHAVALLAAGQPDKAIAACQAAIGKDPDHALAYYQQAAAHRQLAQTDQVRKCLLKAVEIDPKLARAWYALGMLDLELGKPEIAAGIFRRAIKINPNYAAAHTGLGHALKRSGDSRQAMQAFAMALWASRQEPGSPATTTPLPRALAELEERISDPTTVEFHYALAAQANQENMFPPSQVPAATVAGFFDQYAPTFDDHLTGRLHYQAPQIIAAALAPFLPARKIDVLDLGCGTGLCGPLLRPAAATLGGVDLSPGMIEKARARGVYDHLEVGDMVQALLKSPLSFDLLVAADVMVYVGDLNPTFSAATGALRPGGLLVFSVEAGQGDRYHFDRKTRRFTHSLQYLKQLTSMHGFKQESIQCITPRRQARQPVHGYLVILRWPGQ